MRLESSDGLLRSGCDAMGCTGWRPCSNIHDTNRSIQRRQRRVAPEGNPGARVRRLRSRPEKHLREIRRCWPEPSRYSLRWQRDAHRQIRADGSYWRTGIQLGGCGDSNRAAVDSPDSFDRYWKMRSTCLFGPPALKPELKRFSRDTDYWRWKAVSSAMRSGNFG